MNEWKWFSPTTNTMMHEDSFIHSLILVIISINNNNNYHYFRLPHLMMRRWPVSGLIFGFFLRLVTVLVFTETTTTTTTFNQKWSILSSGKRKKVGMVWMMFDGCGWWPIIMEWSINISIWFFFHSFLVSFVVVVVR